MNECPNSTVTEFHITAFSTSTTGQFVLFTGVLVMFLLAVSGNLIIMSLVCLVPQLHTPMYFFLCNLSTVDIIYVCTTLPKLMSITLTQIHSVLFNNCITQLYFFTLCADAEIFILTCMAYDRYVAICVPLRYSVIMSRRLCRLMVICLWVISAVNSSVHTLLTYVLSFCHSHEFDHFLCDLKTLITLSSSDTTSREIFMLFEDITIAFLPFAYTITSYVYIISAILKIPSLKGRRKIFSSCTSHLITVILFYGPIIFLYMKPESKDSKQQDKLLSMLYVAAVPMLNPLVYSLRNKQVLGALKELNNVIKNRFKC
ncbi:olfactory receptor 1F1-like [Mixophyes fleayi]|uniref:olfactory receptor 1F1-like n=1 Tax=Mixophyes fleayi TaxID=3061075 RepID=UPI003F4DB074